MARRGDTPRILYCSCSCTHTVRSSCSCVELFRRPRLNHRRDLFKQAILLQTRALRGRYSELTAPCRCRSPPAPPPVPGADYGDPSDGGCKGDNKEVQITGIKGNFCSPKCSASSPCPADVPAGTTAKPECVLQTPGGTGPSQCALICKSNDPFSLMTLLDDLACPPKASCKPISTTAICTYDSR